MKTATRRNIDDSVLRNLKITEISEEEPKNNEIQPEDITIESLLAKQIKLEAELEDSKEWYRTLVEGVLISIVIFNQEGIIRRVNEQTETLFGYSRDELIGKPFEILMPDRFRKQLKTLRKNVLKKKKTKQIGREQDTYGLRKDGSEFPLEFGLSSIKTEKGEKIVATIIDVTISKNAELAYLKSEEQLRQSQRIESIGRLTGGIAHDFNNFLAVIMLHIDMLNLQIPPNSPLQYRVDEIKSVTDNAAKMVKQLLAFSRKQTLQPSAVLLNQVVKEFIKILRPMVGEDIEIQLNLEPDLGICFVDYNQIVQVLMNLAVNARDAMPNGGILKIETANVLLNKKNVYHRSQPLGNYIELTVSDSGIGMDVKTIERIFEPFFTTKQPNKGTGLGLATVYGIIKQSNGFIWVESQPDEGATFKIQFPRIDQPVKIVEKEEVMEEVPRGNETILLVEDEEKIRRAAVEVLNILGYQVYEASDGWHALEFVQQFNKKIDLLLTDVVMPRMNGKDLAEKVKMLHPEINVLFMSGYNDEIIDQHGVLESGVNFLNKPFSPTTLAQKIREVIGQKKVGEIS